MDFIQSQFRSHVCQLENDLPLQLQTSPDGFESKYQVDESHFEVMSWMNYLERVTKQNPSPLRPIAESMVRAICQYQLSRRNRKLWVDRGYKNDPRMLLLEELKHWIVHQFFGLSFDTPNTLDVLTSRIRYLESLMNPRVFPPSQLAPMVMNLSKQAKDMWASLVEQCEKEFRNESSNSSPTVSSSSSTASSATASSSSSSSSPLYNRPTCFLSLLCGVRASLWEAVALVEQESAKVSSNRQFQTLFHCSLTLIQYAISFLFAHFRNTPDSSQHHDVSLSPQKLRKAGMAAEDGKLSHRGMQDVALDSLPKAIVNSMSQTLSGRRLYQLICSDVMRMLFVDAAESEGPSQSRQPQSESKLLSSPSFPTLPSPLLHHLPFPSVSSSVAPIAEAPTHSERRNTIHSHARSSSSSSSSSSRGPNPTTATDAEGDWEVVEEAETSRCWKEALGAMRIQESKAIESGFLPYFDHNTSLIQRFLHLHELLESYASVTLAYQRGSQLLDLGGDVLMTGAAHDHIIKLVDAHERFLNRIEKSVTFLSQAADRGFSASLMYQQVAPANSDCPQIQSACLFHGFDQWQSNYSLSIPLRWQISSLVKQIKGHLIELRTSLSQDGCLSDPRPLLDRAVTGLKEFASLSNQLFRQAHDHVDHPSHLSLHSPSPTSTRSSFSTSVRIEDVSDHHLPPPDLCRSASDSSLASETSVSNLLCLGPEVIEAALDDHFLPLP